VPTPWQEWERKVGEIFGQIGLSKSDARGVDLQPGSYCFERLNPDMQVDVSARIDRNTYVLVECRDRRNKTLKPWLQQVRGRCETRTTEVVKAHGGKRPRVYGVAATSLRSIEERVARAARETGVELWHHGLVDYLRAVSRGAGSQVRDLVLYRCGIRKASYPPVKLRVMPWTDPTRPWGVGFIAPLDIAQVAFVYQRGQGFGEAAYQRYLKPRRIEEIANFVKGGRVFPNSIVLALPSGTKMPSPSAIHPIRTITVAGDPEGIKIIDGQHRFFGALASGLNPKLLCTLVAQDDLEQAITFASINGKQVAVSKSQLLSLFGVPGFAAKIAADIGTKERAKLERDEACYRALERLNADGPLAGRLNFFPGRPAEDEIPFKTLFDTIRSISSIEQSGFNSLRGSATERGRTFGDGLVRFLETWRQVLGQDDFENPKRWFQPTMLSALLLTYPDCKYLAPKGTAGSSLLSRRREFGRWRVRPENFRGSAGVYRLARSLCSRLGIRSHFL
jgi:DGQHR domain-containing protein